MFRNLLAVASGIALTFVLFSPWRNVEAQSPGESTLDHNSVSLRLTAGESDAEPTDWSGSAGSARWTLRTDRARKKGQPVGFVLPSSAVIAAARGERLSLSTRQGNFAVTPATLGHVESALDGRLQIETLPPTAAIASGPLSEDYPACAAAPNKTIWCAFVRYDPGSPVDREATHCGDFGSLRPNDNGDQILLLRFDGRRFTSAEVTGPGRDVWRPAVIADAANNVWIVWSEKQSGDWELLARRFNSASGGLGPEQRLTSAPGADINPVLARDSKGKLWLAWQVWRSEGGTNTAGFDILLAGLSESTAAKLDPQLVSSSPANDWNPAIAVDSSGGVWVAWDTYARGDYDVYARRFVNGRPSGAPAPVAASARFEARPSIAVDSRGRP